MFSRQAGKNESIVRVQRILQATNLNRANTVGITAAPTQDPQALRAHKRLRDGWTAAFRAWEQHPDHNGKQHPFRRFFRSGTDVVTLGSCEWWFGSGEPDANVVGATANLLLHFDEAQQFDQEKHDRDYSPMAAATACARAYTGTAWTDFDVLAQAIDGARAQEKRTGRQLVFIVPWWDVAAEVPAYGRFVESERERLGHTETSPHPVFQTEYELKPIAGAGRFFTPAQLDLLQGTHPKLDAPQTSSHNVYVAGLDIGGADLSGSGDPDETVLTIGRARFPGRGRNDAPATHVVAQYTWKGVSHEIQQAETDRLLDHWRVKHTAIDATGIGEPAATHLLARYGESRVSAVKLTRARKSSIGFDLLAAINVGGLKVWKPDGPDPDHAALAYQLRRARKEPLPGGAMAWYLDPSDGHDDRLMSLALLNYAAQRGRPRVARTRN